MPPVTSTRGDPDVGTEKPAAIWRDLMARFRMLATSDPHVADTTRAEYAQVATRIERLGWQAILARARSRSAHDVCRAAIRRWAAGQGAAAIRDAHGLLAEPREAISARDVSVLIERLRQAVQALEACRPVAAGGQAWGGSASGGRGRGKRGSLGSLPPDWRGRILARIPEHGPYGLAVACLWLLGVRPRELVHGIRIRVTPDGVLLAVVRGAKLRDAPGEPPRGQPWRKMAVRPGPEAEPALQRLRHAAARSGNGDLVVSVPDARRLSDAVRAASRRAFPLRRTLVSPYTFRHAWSADAKASAAGTDTRGASADESGSTSAAQAAADTPGTDSVSLALGHASAISRRHYGTRRQARGGGIALLGVLAARPLRRGQPSLRSRPPPGAPQPASPEPKGP